MIGAMMNMGAVQGLSSQNIGGEQSGGGADFSSMLNSMMGSAQGGADSLLAGLGSGEALDYSALLGGVTGGLRLLDGQNNAAMQALTSLLEAQNPQVSDPVLTQLLEVLKSQSKGEGGDITDLIGQMQQRLREILEEDGTTMASQEALSLMSQIMPLLAPPATAESNMQTLNAAGGQAALDMILQQSPENLANLMQGQGTQQNPAAQVQAQPQGPAEVLPQAMLDTSAAQLEFTKAVETAKGVTQPSETTAATSSATKEGPLVPEDAEIQVKTGSGSHGLSQMLETGKAQGDFASAVRAVKDQMAAGEVSAPQEELDVDELQQRVDATVLPQTAKTATLDSPIQEVRGTPEPVPDQVQSAIVKGLANGEQELVVKLNPEELGEVTIRMQKAQDGSIALHIIAKNPETQRILSGELAQLQQNLKPLNAEVESIITDRQFQMAGGQQQFGGQHQREWREMHGAAYYRDGDLAPQDEPVVPTTAKAVPTSVLDAYI